VKANQIVVSGFDLTGNMVKPWAEAGYTCYCVDIQHPEGETVDGNIIYVGVDIRRWLPPYGKQIIFQSFFPPCTDLATSGARWFKEKGLPRLVDALDLFCVAIRLAEWSAAPFIIENPVSTVSNYWRKPDYIFNPNEYAGYLGGEDDTYTKRTCLWTGNGFIMPSQKPLPPTKGSMMYQIPPGVDRANLRSKTPIGFARAVFEANRVDGGTKVIE